MLTVLVPRVLDGARGGGAEVLVRADGAGGVLTVRRRC